MTPSLCREPLLPPKLGLPSDRVRGQLDVRVRLAWLGLAGLGLAGLAGRLGQAGAGLAGQAWWPGRWAGRLGGRWASGHNAKLASRLALSMACKDVD